MRRAYLLIAAVFGLTSLVDVSGRAAPVPTITGPTVVPYFASVHLTGTTPLADESVTIYARTGSATSYTKVRTVTSNGSGAFTYYYRAGADRSFYVRAGGVDSTVHTTRLVSATCSVSHPLFYHLPLADPSATSDNPDFAAMTATRNGVWGGVNVDASTGRFAVLRWTAGAPPKVVAQFTYRGVSFEPYQDGSVSVVGVSSTGSIVAAVQRTTSNFDATREQFVGRVWIGSRWHRLVGPPSWRSIHPTGLAANDTIYGYVNAGTLAHPDFKVVRWLADGTDPHVLVDTGAQQPFATVDGAGDVAYTRADGNNFVRRADGTTVALPGLTPYDDVLAFYGGPGHTMYGYSDEGQMRWDLGSDGATIRMTLLAGRNGNNWLRAAGPHGEIVDGYATNVGGPSGIHLRTGAGAWVRVPHPLGLLAGETVILGPAVTAATSPAVTSDAVTNYPRMPTGFAVSEHGALAFTAASDHLVHLLRCH